MLSLPEARETGPESVLLGLDLGGAHLKAALLLAGKPVAIREVACRLWEGLDRLEAAFSDALADWPEPGSVALTMTGELVDLFPDRATGVLRLLDAVTTRFPGRQLVLWSTNGFLAPEAAAAAPLAVASANWCATAELLARRLPAGILVDIGSTTTDLVPFAGGRVRARGLDDAGRLAEGELVYQGIVRTPLMALAERVPFRGRPSGVMAEYFATTADVFRLLGRLEEDFDRHPAADGGPKTVEGSARRLLRMIGADLGPASLEEARILAAVFAEAQLRRIADGLALLLSRGELSEDAPLVAAGCGAFLVEELARRTGRRATDLATVLGLEGGLARWARVAAPALAVALLALEARAQAA
ncbi:MAG: hydantoinase/oxoprolinase [Geminicoccaceae bacterium]|nr:hydantoinase/oxoprolinase [Geminicoccaceae bacterium]